MTMVTRLNDVLKSLSQLLASSSSSVCYSVVSGNQSGDLDSIVSAISYSYFSHIHNSKVPIVPLLNFTRRELNSRKDALLLFEKYNINTKHLFFTDDLPQLGDAVGIILVDHNTLQGKVKELEKPVEGIIDHHEDEGSYLNASPRIIGKAGSCSSLVFKYWYDLIDDKQSIDHDIIKFLLAPLVIDTTNLTSKVEKVDIEASKIYQTYLSDFNADFFFKEIKTAKNDIEGLPASDVFAKDYKDFEVAIGSSDVLKRVGVTSVVKSFDWLWERFPNLNYLAMDFLKKEDVDFFMIMTSFLDENHQFTRELGIIELGEANKLLSKLVISSVSQNLSLSKIEKFAASGASDDASDAVLEVFQQKNIASSRKQVIPAFKKAFESL